MAKKKLTVEEEYLLLSQEEQILLRPDTMIGSVVEQTNEMWAYDFESNKIKKQELTYIPAYLKLFDEILTNASDHANRDKGVTTIKVNINDDWTISVWNDGEGIPIVKHTEHNMYIPEMVLGRLNSGSNYNDTEERYGAGRNGVGSFR
jgi:DNA topoisomerase II